MGGSPAGSRPISHADDEDAFVGAAVGIGLIMPGIAGLPQVIDDGLLDEAFAFSGHDPGGVDTALSLIEQVAVDEVVNLVDGATVEVEGFEPLLIWRPLLLFTGHVVSLVGFTGTQSRIQ